MILTVLFFLIVGFTILSGASFMALKDINSMQNLSSGRVSYYVAESGIEDAVYRIKNNLTFANNTINLDGKTGSVTITTDYATGRGVILSLASTSNYFKRAQTDITLATNVAFYYGIQAGNGGFTLANSSSITGNVYSDGSVVGSGNYVYGNVVSAGATGLVYGIHSTSSVYAHTIGGSAATTIDRNAYYQTTTGTVTVSGTRYASSTDQATTSLPIPDWLITQWENLAASGTVYTTTWCNTVGTYSSKNNACQLTAANVSVGTGTIPFDLEVKGSGNNGTTLTVSGPLWIKGTATVDVNAVIRMASSLGNKNVAIIADNPSNSTSSGEIIVANGSTFYGSGTTGSYVFMISQNNDAQNGGSNAAISMGQGSSALVAYASHGLVTLNQTTQVASITGYQIALSQSANVVYDTGLSSVLFASGSGGNFSIVDWGEI